MIELGFITLMGGLQWLSIWHGVARINKKDAKKRDVCFKQTFCTMGLPAILGVLIALVLLFTSVPNYVSIIIYIALSILFAFCGNALYKKLFVKKNQKKK